MPRRDRSSEPGSGSDGPPGITGLTGRQRQVAALIARGYTNKQIATELTLTAGTVANHVEHILDRLRLTTRSQVATWAVEHGLATTQDRLLTVLEQLLDIDALSLERAMAEASELLRGALGADKVDVFLHDPAADALVAAGTSRGPMGELEHALGLHRLPLDDGGRTVDVFRRGQPYRTGRANRDARELPAVKRALGVHSTLAQPLDVGGRRRGVLVASATAPDAFTERDLRFLRAVSRWVGSVAHRAELVQQAVRRAAQPQAPVARSEPTRT